MIYRRKRKEYNLIIFLTLLKLLLHLFANSNFGFHRDELLYKALGQHMDWGYNEVPPFVAGVSYLTDLISSESVFISRLFPTLFSCAIIFITGLFVLTMGGKRFPILIACGGLIFSPAFLASGYLLQPVIFDQFFWVLSAFLISRYIKTHNENNIYWFGVIAGIGMLTKYSIAFFIIALIAGLLISNNRKLLRNTIWLKAALIAFVIFLPNLIWQINHGLPVIKHMGELKRTQLAFNNPFEFMIQLLLVNASTTFIWMSGLVYLFVSKANSKLSFLAWSFIIVFTFLILLQGKVYYGFGAFPMLFAAGGMCFQKVFGGISEKLKYAIPAVIILPSVIFLPIAIPLLPLNSTLMFFSFVSKDIGLSFPLKWEDQKMHKTTQDYADMMGWEEIAIHVNTAYKLIPADEVGQTTIFASNYGQAGAIDCYGKRYNLPKSVCLNSSFTIWAPDTIQTKHFIYVDDEFPDDLIKSFGEYKKIGEVKNEYAREKGTFIYLFSNPKEDINVIYRKHKAEQLN